MVADAIAKESGIHHASMVRDVTTGLQEVFSQGYPNEYHKDAPYMEQPEEYEVTNQVVTAVTETITSQQKLDAQLLQVKYIIQAMHLVLSNIQGHQKKDGEHKH